MSVPFFSIVIPSLNEEFFLPRLLESIKNQNVDAHYEVIVVDGNSHDKTVEKARTFIQSLNIQIFINNESNVSGQRNFGAQYAKGDYLVFLDADVILFEDFLKKLTTKILKLQVDYASTRTIPESPLLIDKIFCWFTAFGIWLMNKIHKPFMGGQCLIVKRSVFQAVGGFAQDVVHAEDHELVQRINSTNKYQGRFFFDIIHSVSWRRFVREGRWSVISKYIWSFFYVIFKGPIKKPIFDYKMGGEIGEEKNV